MDIDYKDFRMIMMFVDEKKNIVMFPMSKSKIPVKMADGSFESGMCIPSFFPLELKFPYDIAELVQKIKTCIENWNIHECFDESKEKSSIEEKYFGIKGFKNATKGVLQIDLGWNEIQGKYVSLLLPLKRGKSYIGIDETRLSIEADWEDFANAVIYYIDADITQFTSFKTYKRMLNI